MLSRSTRNLQIIAKNKFVTTLRSTNSNEILHFHYQQCKYLASSRQNILNSGD